MTDEAAQRTVATLAGLAVLLIVCFSTKPSWQDEPGSNAARVVSVLHVQPTDRVLGGLDEAAISNGDPVTGQRSLAAQGWVVSCVLTAPVKKVAVLVDGEPAGDTDQFFPRPDVAQAYGRLDFNNSGWQLDTFFAQLPSGPHVITLRALLANGESVDLPGKKAWAP